VKFVTVLFRTLYQLQIYGKDQCYGIKQVSQQQELTQHSLEA